MVNSNTAVGTEFSDVESDEAYPHGYELHYWHQARFAILLDTIKKDCDSSATILEVGAGRGYYVGALREKGFAAYGCDLSTAPTHANAIGFVHSGTDFKDLEPSLLRSVKTVLLLDVLEHIEDPAAFLAAIKKETPSLETVIVTVPARSEIWSNYDEHFRHFLRYDIAGIAKVASRSGMTIKRCGYFFHMLYLPSRLMKSFGFQRRTAFVAPKNNFIHKLLGLLFKLEYWVIPEKIYGTSIICVCKL